MHACGVTRNWRTYFMIVMSLLSRDSRIADCTVRHPGVERPFCSYSSVHFTERIIIFSRNNPADVFIGVISTMFVNCYISIMTNIQINLQFATLDCFKVYFFNIVCRVTLTIRLIFYTYMYVSYS